MEGVNECDSVGLKPISIFDLIEGTSLEEWDEMCSVVLG